MAKLTYFPVTAMGEPIRWILKVNNVEFEDERIELSDWPAVKRSGRFPLQQLPLFEMDGEIMTQTCPILRYLGNKFGMVGDSALENFRLDEAVEILNDGRMGFRRWLLSPDDKKNEVKDDLLNNLCPLVLTQLNEIVGQRDGDYILGSKLTWADLFLAVWLEMWEMELDSGLLDPYPRLQKLKDAVQAVPQIKAYIESRPKPLRGDDLHKGGKVLNSLNVRP